MVILFLTQFLEHISSASVIYGPTNALMLVRESMSEKDGPGVIGEDSAVNGDAGSAADRTQRIMNALMNTTVLLMGQMMGVVSQVFVETMGTVATEMTTAFAGEEEGQKVEQKMKQELPQVDEKTRAMISEMRRDIYAQIGSKRTEIEPYLADGAYDKGPEIVGRYEFGLPRLTEELDDDAIAQYSMLMASEDPGFTEMFTELLGWMNSLPKLPDKADK
jgi:hypothetical protein